MSHIHLIVTMRTVQHIQFARSRVRVVSRFEIDLDALLRFAASIRYFASLSSSVRYFAANAITFSMKAASCA